MTTLDRFFYVINQNFGKAKLQDFPYLSQNEQETGPKYGKLLFFRKKLKKNSNVYFKIKGLQFLCKLHIYTAVYFSMQVAVNLKV